jgi:hypothetical protein
MRSVAGLQGRLRHRCHRRNEALLTVPFRRMPVSLVLVLLHDAKHANHPVTRVAAGHRSASSGRGRGRGRARHIARAWFVPTQLQMHNQVQQVCPILSPKLPLKWRGINSTNSTRDSVQGQLNSQLPRNWFLRGVCPSKFQTPHLSISHCMHTICAAVAVVMSCVFVVSSSKLQVSLCAQYTNAGMISNPSQLKHIHNHKPSTRLGQRLMFGFDKEAERHRPKQET